MVCKHILDSRNIRLAPLQNSVSREPQVDFPLNPFGIRSWRFCRKRRFEDTRVVFWPLSCYKELKLTTNRFTGRTLHGLLIQMQNISLRSSAMRESKILGFKSDTAVLTFTFRFLSSSLFSLFVPHFFFLLLGIQQASFWWEQFLGKLLGSQDQVKGKVGGQWTFHGHFQVHVTWFFASFSGVLD